MRPQQLLLGLCCLAFGLVVAVAYVKRPALLSRPAAADAPPVTPGLASNAPSAALEVAAKPAPPGKPPFSWREVESEDYHRYIANLRAIGCPEQTIADIVMADVNKLYAEREKPLKTKPVPTPDNLAGETAEQKLERLRQLRELQQEKRWVVKELLGIDLPLDLLPSSGSRDYDAFEVAFRFLPPEKRDAVQMLQEAYWQQSDALKAKYEKKQTPEFALESRQLKDSLREELGKVLTPQELEDYDMRTSSTAKQLGNKLATYFRPSEEEFRQIFRAQREYEDILGQLSLAQPGSAAETAGVDKQTLAQQRAAERQALQQARSGAKATLDEQLKTALGEERFTEYQRSQDRTYDLLARLGIRYGLPQETVLQAYEVQKSFQARPVPTGPGNAQPVNKAEVQNRLNEQLTAILGEQAARGYRRVNGGSVPLP